MLERVKSFLGLTKKPDGLDARKQDERIYAYFCRAKEDGFFKDETKDVSITYRIGQNGLMSHLTAAMRKSPLMALEGRSGFISLNDTIMTNIEYFAKHGRVDITEYNGSFKDWLMNNKDYPVIEAHDPIPFPDPVSPIVKPKEDEGVCAIVDRLEVYERGSLSDKTKDIVIIYHHAGSQSPKTVHFAMEKARVSQLSHLVGKVYPLNDDIRRYIGTLPRDQNIDITGHPSLGDYILTEASKR